MAMPRKRRTTRQIEDLPGLFDAIDIDMTRNDIAGDIIEQQQKKEQARRTGTDMRPDSGMDLNPQSLQRPEAVRFISFGSGSSGNCAYIGTSEGGLLIDAGVDNKVVEKRLAENGIDMRTISAILLTHDHSDHVHYAYTLLRANRHLQLLCTPRTLNGLLRRHSISRRITDYHKAIYKEFPFQAGGFTVTAFETSHDGSDNVGFAIDRGDHHFVVTTDTGFITERADYYMRRATYLMLESNYDADMLRRGRYPEYLKARIQGQRGHMDNADSAAYVERLLNDAGSDNRLTHLFLCHLSQDNNTPQLALDAMSRAIAATGHTIGDASGSPAALAADIQLMALPRYDASPLFIFRSKM